MAGVEPHQQAVPTEEEKMRFGVICNESGVEVLRVLHGSDGLIDASELIEQWANAAKVGRIQRKLRRIG